MQDTLRVGVGYADAVPRKVNSMFIEEMLIERLRDLTQCIQICLQAEVLLGLKVRQDGDLRAPYH